MTRACPCCGHPAARYRLCRACYDTLHRTTTGRRIRFARAFSRDIDVAVVVRLKAGEQIPATAYERRAAVQQLAAAGTPKLRIAQQLRIDARQVYRDLERGPLTLLRDPAAEEEK